MGRYCVHYTVPVFVYVDTDLATPDRVTRVIVDDGDLSEALAVYSEDDTELSGAPRSAITAITDGGEQLWPAWEFGW